MAHGFKGHELWLAALVVGLDQASKGLVRSRFQLGESVSVIDGLFDIARVHNTGTAFGFMNGIDFPFKSAVLAGVALVALGGGMPVAAQRQGLRQPGAVERFEQVIGDVVAQ